MRREKNIETVIASREAPKRIVATVKCITAIICELWHKNFISHLHLYVQTKNKHLIKTLRNQIELGFEERNTIFQTQFNEQDNEASELKINVNDERRQIRISSAQIIKRFLEKIGSFQVLTWTSWSIGRIERIERNNKRTYKIVSVLWTFFSCVNGTIDTSCMCI